MAAFVWRRSGIIEYLDVARAVADRFGFHILDDAVLAIIPCWSMREQHVQKSCRRATAQFHGRVAQSTHYPSLLHLIFPAYRTAPEDLSVNASNFSMAHILPV